MDAGPTWCFTLIIQTINKKCDILIHIIKKRGQGMIKIAVCDDEQYFIEEIKEILIEYSEEIQTDISVSEFCDGVMLLEQYDCRYDIVFLDIKMPYIDGIGVAEKIRDRDQMSRLFFNIPFNAGSGWISGSRI